MSTTGTATVRVGADRSVTVNITVSGMTPTAAHIHQGAAGANGPVIVPLLIGMQWASNSLSPGRGPGRG